MQIDVNIRIELWPTSRLIPRITNPRTHTPEQVAQVAASMREFGWTNPILPVIQLGHLTEPQRRALVIADNQLALNARWSEEMLHLELQSVQQASFDLSLVGFDDAELARLLADQEGTPGLTDEDSVPETPDSPVSTAGDLWRLGPPFPASLARSPRFWRASVSTALWPT